MFQVEGIAADQRLVLPQKLLGLLLTACREQRPLRIAICDQLCPALDSNPKYFPTGYSIPQVLTSLLQISPPNSARRFVNTMAPDKCDQARFAPEKIRDQWRSIFDASTDWQNIPFEPRARVEFYSQLPDLDAVVHTSSTEPYANVLLELAPGDSRILKAIPTPISPALANRLSYLGHSHLVVAASAGTFPDDTKLGLACQRFETSADVTEMARILSQALLPDSYEQPTGCVASEPLYLHGFGSAEERTLRAQFPTCWQSAASAHLSVAEFGRELAAQRTVALVVSPGAAGKAVAFRNGVTQGV